ncbi:hypothetical protein ACQ4PT_070012 [Festuca glaucescens]
MEDSDFDSLPTAMEVSTSAWPPQLAIPSRVMVIGEGEIQRLRKHLKELSTSTGNLEKHLERLCSPLVELSEKEDPSITAKCWMKQVRQLFRDTGDYLHNFMQSSREFDMLDARARNASERLERYGLRPKTPSIPMVRRLPAPHANLIDHIHKDMVDKVEHMMGTDKELKVVSIVGPEGVGKTTLAKELYRRCIARSGELHCWAFLRVSAKPDIPRLLTSMFTQILRKLPSRRLSVHDFIDTVARYLLNKRYFIIIDDLWTADVWDIIIRAFPGGDCSSRIITTTQFMDVAMTCCGHLSEYVFKMLPLGDVQSRNLFFRIVFGSASDCPRNLIEVSDGIIRKCGGLPLATINIASMLPSTVKLEEWTGIHDSLPSTWGANPSSEWMKEVVNLMFSTLRPHLKSCLLYFSMYPKGYIVRKDDLVRQCVVEGFLDGDEGQATEEAVGLFFDELVRRGMIQPVDSDKNGKVLSCTLHRTIHDVIVNKSMEENFVIIADYFQSAIPLPDKVHRLSVQFGGARSAYIPESILVSEVRSLAFFGFCQCLPVSMVKYMHVRVLILHIWADEDKHSIDLAEIHELHLLRYLKIACNIAVKLPDKIQGQQNLETIEVSTLAAIPQDIGELSKLRILKIAVTKLSNKHIYSLQILPALYALSVHVKTAPSKLFFFRKGGFSVLKFFTFRCSEPRLVINENAMPKVEKVNLCFKAHKARQDGKKPITIRHLPSLQEISVKIGGTVADASSALANAFTNHAKNPIPIVQMMESSEDQEHGTLEVEVDVKEENAHEYHGPQEQGSGECGHMDEDRDETPDDDVKEENAHEYHGPQEQGSGECGHMDEDRNETPDDDSEKDENKDADSSKLENLEEKMEGKLEKLGDKMEGISLEVKKLTCLHSNRHSDQQPRQEPYREIATASGLRAKFHLRFLDGLKTPIYTEKDITSEGNSAIRIGIFDSDGNMIKEGPLSKAKVEMLVLSGDFCNDGRESWTEEEFNSHIAQGRHGQGFVLRGDCIVWLNNGEASFGGTVRFKEGSSRTRSRKFVIGARVCVDGKTDERVQEAVMMPVTVLDRRNEASEKRHPPELDDEVYRLEEISKDGVYSKRLKEVQIFTVKDFLKALNKDANKLREVLRIKNRSSSWGKMVKHVRECSLTDRHELIAYRNEAASVVLFFNCVYDLVGAEFSGVYVERDNFDAANKALANVLKEHACSELDSAPFSYVMNGCLPVPVSSSENSLVSIPIVAPEAALQG